MCKTIGDSLLSGSIALSVAVYLLFLQKAEYTWLAYFMISGSSMQWSDALVWYNKQNGYDTDILSRYVNGLILASQPVAVYLGYLLLNRRMPVYEAICGIYITFMLYMWITQCKETTVTSDGYLKWCDFPFDPPGKIIHLALILFPFLYYPNPVIKAIVFLSVIGTWLYNYSRESFGSGWCHSQNFAALLLLGLVARD